jgi:hypothetical protein
MNKLLSLLILFFLFSTLLLGQEDKTYFKAGSKAFLFEFRGLDNLSANSFNGGIGGKYFLMSNMAVRGGLQFVSISEDSPFQGTGGADGEAHATQYGIFGAVEMHLNTSRVSPYWGGGLEISFTSTESKTDVADPVDQETINNNRNGEFGYFGGTEFNIFGLLGVEIFIVKNLSLAAEYRLGFSTHSYSDQEVTQRNVTVTTKQGSRNEIGVASSGVLTLAVYF